MKRKKKKKKRIVLRERIEETDALARGSSRAAAN